MTSLLARMDRKQPIVLTGATGGFVEIAMSWACNLRMLGVFSNVMVAAFDEDAYTQMYMLGMPVFVPSRSLTGHAKNAFAYGTDTYKAVTKLKTAVVVEVLAAGYDVVWCDPDVVVFRPFVPVLVAAAATHGAFVIQNNNPTSMAARAVKTNSGLYIARAVPWVVAALGDVVRHAVGSRASEQMSWNAVLCRRSSLARNTCFYGNNTIHFLPRTQFATGSESDTATMALREKGVPYGLVAWHNNWITGYTNKIKRATELGQFFWDPKGGHCATAQESGILARYAQQGRHVR